jgi:hypothetical protein
MTKNELMTILQFITVVPIMTTIYYIAVNIGQGEPISIWLIGGIEANIFYAGITILLYKLRNSALSAKERKFSLYQGLVMTNISLAIAYTFVGSIFLTEVFTAIALFFVLLAFEVPLGALE